jgi:NAD(P)-dependent dehydrogenase (short-subunit alcohol dehydrogenase family)
MDIMVSSNFERLLFDLYDRDGAAIVNVGSVSGMRGVGVPMAAYAASKAAVTQFTRSIALEYAARGVRANTVVPGLIRTPLVGRSLRGTYDAKDEEELMAERDRRCPMGHMGTAWDVAHAALFLASREARYITATELVVDGGLSARVA